MLFGIHSAESRARCTVAVGKPACFILVSLSVCGSHFMLWKRVIVDSEVIHFMSSVIYLIKLSRVQKRGYKFSWNKCTLSVNVYRPSCPCSFDDPCKVIPPVWLQSPIWHTRVQPQRQMRTSKMHLVACSTYRDVNLIFSCKNKKRPSLPGKNLKYNKSETSPHFCSIFLVQMMFLELFCDVLHNEKEADFDLAVWLRRW